MPSEITRRVERELEHPGLAAALSKLPASDLRSLLMDACKYRAAGIKEAAILAIAERDPLMAPSTASARDVWAFDSVAFQAASDFDALELSPVCPFAATSTLGGVSQNNVLTTIRNAEVLGDSTIALAMEAARRRRSSRRFTGLVRLCASQRVVRLQPFDVPGYSPHFRLFALVSAGRDSGSFGFETVQLIEHARVYSQLFQLLRNVGFELHKPMFEFTDMLAVGAALTDAGITRDDIHATIRAHRLGGSQRLLRERGVAWESRHSLLESRVVEPLRKEFPEADFRVNQERLEGLGYYCSFALRVLMQAPDGQIYPLADGGFTNWTARLLQNKKERLLISGIGSEFICKTYLA
ncbi:MAG: hypothetical protein JO307_24035 [Bryobacterales bacterium]|nr:hypothetical protein [Bryobacterales bacterium]MBV9396908.1 hypothetical protein [Bryobacterales bacterium]